jgi:hypothetical protein
MCIAAASSLRAQDSTQGPAAWPHVITRSAFGASSELIGSREPDMPLFVTFTGDVDMLDVAALRVPFDVTFLAGFNDRYNPRQVDYSFSFAPALRLGGAELSARYHHTSRHLHDAPRPGPVSWNLVGASLAGARSSRRLRWSGRADASYYPVGWRRYVDYKWETGARGSVTYEVSARWAYYGDVGVRVLQCDASVAGRDRVIGGRSEVGISLGYQGGRGAVFAAFDRRIDVGVLSHDVENIGLVGIRFLVAR